MVISDGGGLAAGLAPLTLAPMISL
jgi:hypothetical protein